MRAVWRMGQGTGYYKIRNRLRRTAVLGTVRWLMGGGVKEGERMDHDYSRICWGFFGDGDCRVAVGTV